MKLVVATGPFFPAPPGPAGAVERLSFDLCRQFSRAGHDTLMVGCSYPGAKAEETLHGVRLLRRTALRSTRFIRFNLALDFLYSRRILPLLPRDAQVWSTNAFWLPFLALRQAPGGRPCLVVNAHRYPKGQYRLYKGVEGIVAVSSTVGEAIIRQCPWTDPFIQVISNPVDTEVFHPCPQEVGSGRRILYTGRLHPLKGLDLLVKACRLLARDHPGLSLRLVGPWELRSGGGGQAYLDRLRELAGNLPLSLPGPVYDREALASELRAASAYVYPSIDEKGEALPVAPMEAMACGLPVVLSRLSCFRDYATPGVDCLEFEHRGESPERNLAAQLGRLLAEPAFAARLGLAAAAAMTSRSSEKIAEEYLSFFSCLRPGTTPMEAPPPVSTR